MPTAKVRNLKNKEVGEVELVRCRIWCRIQRIADSRGSQKLFGESSAGNERDENSRRRFGFGRKLWKQKGTGRARIASIRSPLWKGGGNVHGPQPRDWSYKLPKKMRRGALRSALSERLREGNLIVFENFIFETAKTKDFVGAMASLKLTESKKPLKL